MNYLKFTAKIIVISNNLLHNDSHVCLIHVVYSFYDTAIQE
jgi:hypothetical protein